MSGPSVNPVTGVHDGKPVDPEVVKAAVSSTAGGAAPRLGHGALIDTIPSTQAEFASVNGFLLAADGTEQGYSGWYYDENGHQSNWEVPRSPRPSHPPHLLAGLASPRWVARPSSQPRWCCVGPAAQVDTDGQWSLVSEWKRKESTGEWVELTDSGHAPPPPSDMTHRNKKIEWGKVTATPAGAKNPRALLTA